MTQVTSVDAFWLGTSIPLPVLGCFLLTRRTCSRAWLRLLLRPREELRRAREPAQDRPRVLAQGRDRDGDGAESRGVGVWANVVRVIADMYLQGQEAGRGGGAGEEDVNRNQHACHRAGHTAPCGHRCGSPGVANASQERRHMMGPKLSPQLCMRTYFAVVQPPRPPSRLVSYTERPCEHRQNAILCSISSFRVHSSNTWALLDLR
jgi:hypothetical protein